MAICLWVAGSGLLALDSMPLDSGCRFGSDSWCGIPWLAFLVLDSWLWMPSFLVIGLFGSESLLRNPGSSVFVWDSWAKLAVDS